MCSTIYIVIPVYNEAAVIEEVINELKNCGYHKIIIVDDGSSDGTYLKALKSNAIVIRHRINRGKGAAVKTGFAAANRFGGGVVVTMDGDGQHNPEDIRALVKPIIEDNVDVVLGSRLMDTAGMPMLKILANKIGNMITWLLYGVRVSDSQSGFRAYSKHSATIIDTKADKYEYDSKVLREMKNNRLCFVEVPIEVRYTLHSMGKPQKQGF